MSARDFDPTFENTMLQKLTITKLRQLVSMLTERFSGKIILHCSQGIIHKMCKEVEVSRE